MLRPWMDRMANLFKPGMIVISIIGDFIPCGKEDEPYTYIINILRRFQTAEYIVTI